MEEAQNEKVLRSIFREFIERDVFGTTSSHTLLLQEILPCIKIESTCPKRIFDVLRNIRWRTGASRLFDARDVLYG